MRSDGVTTNLYEIKVTTHWNQKYKLFKIFDLKKFFDFSSSLYHLSTSIMTEINRDTKNKNDKGDYSF